LVTNRIALLCILCVACLMVLYYLVPELFMGPLGIVLLVPGCLLFFIYAIRIFRPR
jgi:hypothetical protein